MSDDQFQNFGSNDPDVRQRIERIVELYLQDLEGGENTLTKWVDQNPDLSPHLEKRLKLVESLYEFSSFGGDAVTRDSPLGDDPSSDLRIKREIARRINCPNCGIQIPVVESVHSTEMTCSGCGSTIQVDSGATRSTGAGKRPKKIGRFKVISLLGRGGFGSVYKATDPSLSRIVAIKIPRDGTFESKAKQERFIREARHSAKLRHPGIVRVYEIGEQHEIPYIVSEFIDGVTLRDLISGQKLDFRRVAKIMAEISEAIQLAHSKGVIHRDIKPSNVLIDKDGKPYVTDFGLAQDSHEEFTITLAGEVLGTPSYMSPEQARADQNSLDARTDVYSLGVMLYRMLSGELPFRGSARMLLHQVIHDDPRPLRRISEHIPAELEIITNKAMSKNPEYRYDSAQAMADDLRHWLNNEPIVAKPDSVYRQIKKWCIRNPSIARLSATILLLLVTSALLGAFWAIRENQLRDQVSSNLTTALENEQESNLRLNHIYLNNGQQRILKRESLSSLPWFFAAFAQGIGDLDLQRLRIGLILNQSPKLVRCWNAGKVVNDGIYSNDGSKFLAVGQFNVEVFSSDDASNHLSLPHQSVVVDAKFSPDGTLIGVVTGDSVVIWSVDSAVPVKVLKHDDKVTQARFNADGSRLISGSIDGQTRIWDVANWTVLQEIETEDAEVKHVGFSPDSSLALIVSLNHETQRTSIAFWEIANNQHLKTIEQDWSLSGFVFNRLGTRLATYDASGKTSVWHVDTGERAGVIEQSSSLARVFFLTDSDRLLTCTRNGIVEQWNGQTFARIGVPIHTGNPIVKADIDSDSSIVALAGMDGQVRLYWLGSGTQLCDSLPHGSLAKSVEFHPDGRRVAAIGARGVIKVWDLAGLAPDVSLLKHEDEVLEAKFSPQGDRVLTASRDFSGAIWSTQTGTQIGNLLQHDLDVLDCDFSANGMLVATCSADKTVKIWDANTSAPIGEPLTHQDVVLRVALSPDSKTVVSGTDSGTSIAWEIATSQEQYRKVQKKAIWSIAFNGNDVVAVGSGDGEIKAWNFQNGILIGSPMENENKVTYCSFDESGTLLAASHSSTASVWSVDNATRLLDRLIHPARVTSSNFNIDASRLITTDTQGGARIWRMSNGNFKHEYQFEFGNMSLIYGEFDRTGKIAVVSGGRLGSPLDQSASGRVFLIEVATGIQLSPRLEHFGGVRRARFSPSSSKLVTASFDNTARIWNLSGIELDSARLAELTSLLSGQGLQGDLQRLVATPPVEQKRLYDRLRESDPQLFTVGANEIQRWEEFKDWIRAKYPLN